VFIEKRDDWVKKLLRTRDYYENGYYTSEWTFRTTDGNL
jgi:hypothetical protein